METGPVDSGRARRNGASLFETLRDDIVTFRLAPGAVLSRAALQERFGVSSTPVRDALLRLQEEGLVEIFPQHATIVAPIDLERARRAQFLRRAVEIEIVRTVAQARDPGVVARLRSLVRQGAAFAELGEMEAFATADQSFHRLTYEAAGVPDLWSLVRRQAGHIDRLRHLNLPVAGKMREILRAHTAIVDAIEAGDPDAAAAALRDHLSRSIEFVDTLRETHPDYFGENRAAS
jgi:DNA-binding GntR family transcriptional regulator